MQSEEPQAVSLQELNFAYPGCPPSLKGVNLDLPKGSRCLLIGANGAGEWMMISVVIVLGVSSVCVRRFGWRSGWRTSGGRG